MSLGVISGRALEAVLRGRGIPMPGRAAVDAYVRSVRVEQKDAILAVMRRIEGGVDQQGEIDQLLAAIRAAEATGGAPSVKSVRPPTARSDELSARKSAPQAEPIPTEIAFLRAHGTHVYATAAALKVELTQARSQAAGGEADVYTVQFEAAAKREVGGYDWTRKVAFQLTVPELPLATAFFLGFGGPALAFKNHGPNSDKHLEILDQGRTLYFKLGHAGQQRVSLPIGPPEVYAITEICMAALAANRPLVSPEARLALLRRVGEMSVKPAGRGNQS